MGLLSLVNACAITQQLDAKTSMQRWVITAAQHFQSDLYTVGKKKKAHNLICKKQP